MHHYRRPIRRDSAEPQAQPDGLTVVAEDPDATCRGRRGQPAEEAQDQPAEDVDAAEPESRTDLETTVERADYLPLFVAPQPVEFERRTTRRRRR